MSNVSVLKVKPVHQSVSAAEWEARVNLAAAYRLCDHYGMSDMIYTHISARVPDEPNRFLLNPHGLLFNEMTASCFLKVDLDGNVVYKPELEQGYGLHAAGFVIHSAIYKARPDVMAVMHTHTIAGMAVSSLEVRAAAADADLAPLLCAHRLPRLQRPGARSRRAREAGAASRAATT